MDSFVSTTINAARNIENATGKRCQYLKLSIVGI